MGEIADNILNGNDCQYCGEYLGEGDGYPRSCRRCCYDTNDKKNIQETIGTGLSFLRTAALLLNEAQKHKKSKSLNNMCDQIYKFSKSLK